MSKHTALDTPVGAPAYLEELLGRVRAAIRVQDVVRTRSALRDVFGFLTRYFAYAWAASAPGHDHILELWARGCTTADLEQMIALALRSWDAADDGLARRLRAVFVSQAPFSHTRLLQGRSLSDWLCSRGQVDADQSLWEVRRLLPVLGEWLESAAPFFRECMHRYELVEGRVELASRIDGRWVQLHLPFRFRDLADRPYRTHQADATFHHLDVVTVHTGGLEALVRQMLESQETRSAGEVAADSRAELPDSPPESRLSLAISRYGVTQNDFGAPCYAGRLHLRDLAGGGLRGSLHCGHPGLRLSSRAFAGQDCAVDYWLDPGYDQEELSRVELVVTTADQECRMPLDELLPQSPLSRLPAGVAGFVLSLPAVVGLAYLSILYRTAVSDVWSALRTVLPPHFAVSSLGRVPLELSSVSPVQLEAFPRVTQTVFFFLLAAVLCPLAVSRIFARFTQPTQRRVGPLFLVGMVLPTAGFLLLRATGMFWSPLALCPQFRALDLGRSFLWFALLNLGATGYLFLAHERLLHRWLTPAARVLLPLTLSGLVVATALLLAG